MARQEQNIDENELRARADAYNELISLRTSQLYTRLKVRYAGGIGISIAVVIRMVSLPLDMALTISTFAFIIAIPLFAYLIFSLDEVDSPFIGWIWTEYETGDHIEKFVEFFVDKKISEKEYGEFIKSKLEETKARAHKRVVKDITVGLVAFLAVIIGFTSFLWHIDWYYSVLFGALSFLMSYRFFRTFKSGINND